MFSPSLPQTQPREPCSEQEERQGYRRVPLASENRFSGQSKMTVLSPLRRTRRWACQFTARDNATDSRSLPIAVSCSGLWVWSTRETSCSMIGPSSRSAVT